MHNDLLSFLARWTLPPGVQDALRGTRASLTVKRRQQSDISHLLSRNAVLRGRHRGTRCFVLATGPSIRAQDLKLLSGEHCIGVSNFFVHPDCDVIRPRYYCVGAYHVPATEDAFQQWLNEMATRTGQATMFFNANDRQRCARVEAFNSRAIHFVQTTGAWDQVRNDILELTKPIPGPATVPIMALQVALYMGYSEIYLLGCDHSWLLHVNESRHFYDERESALVRNGYCEWYRDGMGLEPYFRDYMRIWEQYRTLRDFAARQGIRILNATNGGLLDVFSRVRYEELF